MKGVKQEFKKITWPDKEALTKQSIAVVTTSVVLAGLIALLDMIFKYGIDWLIKL